MLTRAAALLAEVGSEAHALATGVYPLFVTATQPDVSGDDVPVFVFHTINPMEFEQQLAHLSDNGYRTLDTSAFMAHLTGERPAPARSVVLTIDDGRASVWTAGLPLLEKYGFVAVVFLIPGFIREGDGVRPTLRDAWEGRCRIDEVPAADPDLMTWSEIEAAAKSGILDFQSHTTWHHRVPVEDRIIDFLGPHTKSALFDLPLPAGLETDLMANGIESLFGTPLFASAPLMSARPPFVPAAAVVRRCIDAVSEAEGPDFFAQRGWRRRLREAASGAARGRLLEPQATRRALREDLMHSRALLESRLNRPVQHLCYPYGQGSALAVELSREVGYRSNFWTLLAKRRGNQSGDDPFRCPRLKGDYVLRLPGMRRRGLVSVLGAKVVRRCAGRAVY